MSVIFDATIGAAAGGRIFAGGEREFVPVLARAAVAVGVAGSSSKRIQTRIARLPTAQHGAVEEMERLLTI